MLFFSHSDQPPCIGTIKMEHVPILRKTRCLVWLSLLQIDGKFCLHRCDHAAKKKQKQKTFSDSLKLGRLLLSDFSGAEIDAKVGESVEEMAVRRWRPER